MENNNLKSLPTGNQLPIKEILQYPNFQFPKIKPLFSKSAKWRCMLPSDITFINKYKPKMLKTLELLHLNELKIKPQALRNLRRALADAKIISSLIIGHDDQMNRKKKIKFIGSLLNVSNHYKKLSLRFTDPVYNTLLHKNEIKGLIRLQNCKDLSNLEIHFACHEDTKNRIMNRLSQQLRSLKKLNRLGLDFSYCNSYRYSARYPADYDPNALVLKLKYPRSLSSLILNFENAIKFSPQLLTVFLSTLERCSQLKNFELNSYLSLTSVESKDMNFAPLVQSLGSRIQNLTLKSHFSDQNFLPFLEGFSHLKHLITLKLNLPSALSSISQSKIFIETLFSHLNSLENFKSLNLIYDPRRNFESELDILFPALQRLKKLEHLTLSAQPSVKLNDSHLKALSQAIQHLHYLKKFSFDFPTEIISLEGVTPLVQSLQKTSFLNALSLNFKSPFYSLSPTLKKTTNFETSFTQLFSALSGLQLLSNLELDLSAFKVSAEEAKHLCSALKELKELSLLNLSLPEFDSVKNFEGFSSSLKELPKLTSLTVKFQGPAISDRQIALLALTIQECRSLISLQLSFRESKNLTENALRNLSKRLGRLVSLKHLKLEFSKPKGFTPELLFELLEALTVIKGLESLCLDIPGNSQPVIRPPKRTLLDYPTVFRHLNTFVVNEITVF